MMSRRSICQSVLAALMSACGGGGDPPKPTPAPVKLPVVAFYGDSITDGTHSSDFIVWTPTKWSPTPVETIRMLLGFAPTQVIDYSYSGAASTDAKIADDASTIVVIRFGVADAVRGLLPVEFGKNISRLITEARALGKQVLLTGLTHAASADTLPWNLMMASVANLYEVPFVDVYALPFDPAVDLADPLHPSESYSHRIGAVIADKLHTMIG